MSLQARRIGETREQYNRRVGTRRPRTVGRIGTRRLVDPIVGSVKTKDAPKPRVRRAMSDEERRRRREAGRRRKELQERKRAEASRKRLKEIREARERRRAEDRKKPPKRTPRGFLSRNRFRQRRRRGPSPSLLKYLSDERAVGPSARRRKRPSKEDMANAMNKRIMEEANKRVTRKPQTKNPKSVKGLFGRTTKPLTPEQRKKIQQSMIGGRQMYREALKRAATLRGSKTTRGTASARYRGRPKVTTRGTVTAPVRRQRRSR